MLQLSGKISVFALCCTSDLSCDMTNIIYGISVDKTPLNPVSSPLETFALQSGCVVVCLDCGHSACNPCGPTGVPHVPF